MDTDTGEQRVPFGRCPLVRFTGCTGMKPVFVNIPRIYLLCTWHASLCVTSCVCPSGCCRGVGFVNFVDHASALNAVRALHGSKVNDKPLHVALQGPRVHSSIAIWGQWDCTYVLDHAGCDLTCMCPTCRETILSAVPCSLPWLPHDHQSAVLTQHTTLHLHNTSSLPSHIFMDDSSLTQYPSFYHLVLNKWRCDICCSSRLSHLPGWHSGNHVAVQYL